MSSKREQTQNERIDEELRTAHLIAAFNGEHPDDVLDRMAMDYENSGQAEQDQWDEIYGEPDYQEGWG